jgi:hypothetical protein
VKCARADTVRLWDVEELAEVTVLFTGSGALVAYDPDTGLLSASSSGELLMFSMDPDRWVEQACDFVGRDLMQAEWDQYVPGDGPPTSACTS